MGIERATYQGTYRAGVIGHTGRGNYGHGLDVAFVGLPNVQLVAVADADDEGRAEAMERTGAERAYADYREMLAQEKLDLVAIGPRWLDQHEAMTVAARRGRREGHLCGEADGAVAGGGRSHVGGV